MPCCACAVQADQTAAPAAAVVVPVKVKDADVAVEEVPPTGGDSADAAVEVVVTDPAVASVEVPPVVKDRADAVVEVPAEALTAQVCSPLLCCIASASVQSRPSASGHFELTQVARPYRSCQKGLRLAIWSDIEAISQSGIPAASFSNAVSTPCLRCMQGSTILVLHRGK